MLVSTCQAASDGVSKLKYCRSVPVGVAAGKGPKSNIVRVRGQGEIELITLFPEIV